jgi:phage terminase large subunit-like protein
MEGAATMTGLEPHPIFRLPTQEEARAMGPGRFQALIQERARRMTLEQSDPLTFGFKPEIWNVVDDLLVDGNKVILDLTRIAKISPDGKAPNLVDVPKEIAGAPEIWIAGSQRSSKSEYAGRKCVEVETGRDAARGWSFADTGPISIARQQPLFWKYMPREIKIAARETGRTRQGALLNVSYKQKTGFAEQSFVLSNGSQHWFKNYEQDVENVEGDQLDIVWFDELRNPVLLKTIRYRMGDRGGIIIATFTSIDENYTSIVSEYDTGARAILKVPAELLPYRDELGKPTGRCEEVDRIKVAGPGSDGDQRANIVFFHITDNPFYGFTANPKPGERILLGKERFYKIIRGATREKILARAYGILTRTNQNKFPEFNEAVHVIDPDKIEKAGTNYHVVDPCDGRNWAMLWDRVLPRVVRLASGREMHPWRIYREWPSYSPPGYQNNSPSAYIPGVGDIGAWALAGEPRDGLRGPAQNPLGFGLTRYKEEILRCEGNKQKDEAEEEKEERPKPLWGKNKQGARSAASILAMKQFAGDMAAGIQSILIAPKPERDPNAEEIAGRYMDSRYGATPTTRQEGQTTLLEQMRENDMEFLAASGKEIVEGIDLIHELLDYDLEVAIGDWSPRLARINEPLLKISRDCPNLIFALKIWTNIDKGHGAVKDFIDLLRYLALADIDYISAEAYAWQGGGRGY